MYTFRSQLFNLNEVKIKLKNFQYIQKSFFYDNEWLEACFNKKKNKDNIFCVEILKNKKILLAMFFEIKNFFFLKKLTWLFDKDLNFITPIILDTHNFDKKEFNEILKKIFNHFKVDFIQLDKNPLMIENVINPLNYYKNIKYEKIIKIDLENTSWKNYYEGISSSKTRQSDRRKEKLLAKKGKMNFLIANNLNDKIKILNFTLQNKIQFLEKKKLDIKSFKNLYENLFQQISQNSKYICSALELNNNIIASIIGRVQNNNYYYLIPSTNENENLKYSPGRILLKKQIKWCFENNFQSFDFGPGDFEYKNKWSNDYEDYFRILEPKSFFGNILYFLLKIKLSYMNSDFFKYIRTIFKV